MKPFLMLFIIVLMSKTFILTLCEIYLVPIISQRRTEQDVKAKFYISCHKDKACNVKIHKPGGKTSSSHLKPLGTMTYGISLMIVPRLAELVLDQSHEPMIKVTVGLGEKVTIVVGYESSTSGKYYNTVSACPLSEPNAFFIVTVPKLANYVLVLVFRNCAVFRYSKSKITGRQLETVKTYKGGTLIMWDKSNRFQELEGTRIRATHPLSVCIGGHLTQSYVKPFHESWGTRFLMVVPVRGSTTTLVYSAKTTTTIKVEYRSLLGGVFVFSKSRKIIVPQDKGVMQMGTGQDSFSMVSEIYCKSQRPIGLAFTMQPPAYSRPWTDLRPPFSTLTAMNHWSQQVYVQVPYDNLQVHRQVYIVAPKRNFQRIMVNKDNLRQHLKGKQRFIMNINYMWGWIDHRETLYISMEKKENTKYKYFTAFMYSLVQEKGYYFSQVKSCKTKWKKSSENYSRMKGQVPEHGDNEGHHSDIVYYVLIPVTILVLAMGFIIVAAVRSGKHRSTGT